MKRYLTLIVLLIIYTLTGCSTESEKDELETAAQKPFTELTSTNFEVVIVYENLQPAVETILTIYISDFKTNQPIDNAAVTLDISGAEVIEAPKRIDPGVYESKIIFPDLQKNDFLVSVSANGIEDLLAVNEVDLSQKEEVIIEQGFMQTILESILFWIAAGIILFSLTAILFYKLGKDTRIKIIKEKKV